MQTIIIEKIIELVKKVSSLQDYKIVFKEMGKQPINI